jgi:serine/threonine protein kinase
MTQEITQEQWRWLSAAFDQAVELDDEQRESFLDHHFFAQPQLRQHLLVMLESDAKQALIDTPLTELIPPDCLLDQPERLLGAHFGAYILDSVIGRGGMGVVYLAHRHGDFEQKVAIKQLISRINDGVAEQRFIQERQILANLSHVYITRLLDGGIDANGQPWFAMEHIEGKPITSWANSQALGLAERITLLMKVGEAVQHAHSHLVVHRDLKPDNIHVDANGAPKVLDFGVAKLIDPIAIGSTLTGSVAAFTPEYATPEQVCGEPVTTATDVYALGLILYELLCDRLPYDLHERDLQARIKAITCDAPIRLDQAIAQGAEIQVRQRLEQRLISLDRYRRFVRGDLTRIVQTALAKEPERRYATVQTFMADLQNFLDGRPVSVSGDTLRYRALKFVQRHRWSVLMACIAIGAAGAGALGILHQSQRAHLAAERADIEAKRARAEADDMIAANEFLRKVFARGKADHGSADITLRQALDKGVEWIEQDPTLAPRSQVQFLLSAADNYESFGDVRRAEELVRQALKLQEEKIPENKSERGRALLELAWLRVNAEPEQALAWAEEGIVLLRASDTSSVATITDAYTNYIAALYTNKKYEDGLRIVRALRQYLLDNGDNGLSGDMISTLSNESILLQETGRYEEAVNKAREAIELRKKTLGPDHPETLYQQMFLARPLNKAGRPEEALQQLIQYVPAVQAAMGLDHPDTHSARLMQARILAVLGRDAESLPFFKTTHEFGKRHPFASRQAVVATEYATALAKSGNCSTATALLAEMEQRQLQPVPATAKPLEGTSCLQPAT